MQAGQDKIYFIVNNTVEGAMKSPYMEPLKDHAHIPVLILNNNYDEMIFNQQGLYKNKKFVNIENNFEEIMKDLGIN